MPYYEDIVHLCDIPRYHAKHNPDEIAFIYDAKRSASVTSTNYTTLGKIPEEEIKHLFDQYPFFKKELVKRTIRYDDDLKIFLESILKTIDYL